MNSDDSGCIPTNSSRGQQCPDEIRNLGTGSFPVLFENKGSDYLKQLWLERGGGGGVSHLYTCMSYQCVLFPFGLIWAHSASGYGVSGG